MTYLRSIAVLCFVVLFVGVPTIVSCPTSTALRRDVLEASATATANELGGIVARQAFASTLAEPLEIPAVDRWDDLLVEVSDGDLGLAALLKAFLSVESTGSQYAVSPTGCAGLMQFCTGTAVDRRFEEFFRPSNITRCDCRKRRCRVRGSVRDGLESDDAHTFRRAASKFPCDISDDRFDPWRSLSAAKLYIQQLHARYGGNLELTYLAYNSGPAVADRIFERLGEDEAASVPEVIEAVKSYPRHRGRMKDLADITLPKVREAYSRYLYVQPVAEG
jgi:hypothetical protein